MDLKKYDVIALALQGGGALGSYFIGMYKALEEQNAIPSVVSGISIGAFTGAIIAGNPPETRLAKLESFWKAISWPTSPEETFLETMNESYGFISKDVHHALIRDYHAWRALLWGQPNFFHPHSLHPALAPIGSKEAVSYYDTSIIRETLSAHIDFKYLNEKHVHLLLGAVRVKDAKLVFFDSFQEPLTVDHVIASGSLPPAFTGVRIDGDLYWDGGCVGNSPIEGIYQAGLTENTLVFMADLFTLNGPEPETMDQVLTRLKDMQYAHRSLTSVGTIKDKCNYRLALSKLWEGLSDDMREDPMIKVLMKRAISISFDIVNLVYDPEPHENHTKDYDFSIKALETRIIQGYQDTKHLIENEEVFKTKPAYKSSDIYNFAGLRKKHP